MFNFASLNIIAARSTYINIYFFVKQKTNMDF